MAEFQAQSDTFLDWFKSQPGSTFHASLKLSDLRDRDAGRGIIALNDIPADTDLFTIPRASIINVENSELSKKLPSLFESSKDTFNGSLNSGHDNIDDDDDDENSDMPNSWLNLILVLIYEHLRGHGSAWKSYLDVLPESKDFSTLMFWNEEELKELQASAVSKKIGKQNADYMFQRQILPIVQQHQDVFYPSTATKLSDREMMQLAHRMGSLIMAYAFDLENEEDSDEYQEDGWVEDRENQLSMGMVPMADMLNADAEFNAHLSHGEENLTMTSLRPIKAGEEVLNYYGPLPNCELLRRYGYTSTKHARYDVVEISWDLVKDILAERWKDTSYEDPFGDDDDEVEESFVLERETGDPDETGRTISPASFTTFPEELVEQVNRVNAAAKKIDLDSKVSSLHKDMLRNELFEVMAKVLKARSAQFSTTIEEDERLLANDRVTRKHQMAVDVRLGEKRLLHEALMLVKELQQKLEQKYGEVEDKSEAPPAKKQKTSK